MKERYKKFFNEKVSDIDNVRNRSIEEFRKYSKDKNFNRGLFLNNNKKYSIFLYKDKPEKQNIKITFHFGKYRNSEFKNMYPNRWDIFIDTKDFADDTKYNRKTKIWNYSEALDEIESTIVHEITHASQNINGSLDYLRKGGFWDKSQTEIDREKYGIHASKPTEQEAVLVQFLFLIQQNKFKKAYEELDYRDEYFRNFDFKDFVKKAYSIGIQKNEIIKFQQFAIKVVEDKINDFIEEDWIVNDNDFYSVVKLRLSYIRDLKILFSKQEYKKIVQKNIDLLSNIIKKYPNLQQDEDYPKAIQVIKKFVSEN